MNGSKIRGVTTAELQENLSRIDEQAAILIPVIRYICLDPLSNPPWPLTEWNQPKDVADAFYVIH